MMMMIMMMMMMMMVMVMMMMMITNANTLAIVFNVVEIVTVFQAKHGHDWSSM